MSLREQAREVWQIVTRTHRVFQRPGKRTWVPRVGDQVCDCRYNHQRVLAVSEDGVEARLEDGAWWDVAHCLDPVPHPEWEHPTAISNRTPPRHPGG